MTTGQTTPTKELVSATEFLGLLNSGNPIMFKICNEDIHIPAAWNARRINIRIQSSELKSLYIEKVPLTSLDISENSIISEKLFIDNSDFSHSSNGVLSISHSEINSIEIVNLNASALYLNETKIKDKIKIRYGTISKVMLSNSEIGELEIFAQTPIQDIHCGYTTIGFFKIDAEYVSDINFYRISPRLISFSVKTVGTASFGVSKILGAFMITGLKTIENKFEIYGVDPSNDINKLYINAETTRGPLLIENLNLNSLRIKGKLDGLMLENINIHYQLNLENASLANTTFKLVDLRNASLILNNTDFNKPKFVGVKWSTVKPNFDIDELSPIVDTDDSGMQTNRVEKYLLKLIDVKEGYRQLKRDFTTDQNHFDAMLFLNQELKIEHQIKTIQTWSFFRKKNFFKKSEWKLWFKNLSIRSFIRNFSDWFLLQTNNTFSNFGLSWIKPLFWWLFVFHLIPFYFIILNSTLPITPIFDMCNFEFANFDPAATSEGFKLYMKLLFPVHDSTISMKMNGKVYEDDIWGINDLLLRVFASYFIFIIIRGTRKFNFRIGQSTASS